jgi:tetratricopeptide (TPR) repeat protein
MRRIVAYLVASLVIAGMIGSPSQSAFAQQPTQKKEEAKAEKKKSPAFLSAWKNISSTVNKKRTSKTAQGVETAGVRGKEAEDQIIDQMYFRGGTAYPGRSKIEAAILTLQQVIEESDASDPASTAEFRFYIGQCYEELGQNDKAIASYDNVVKVASKSEWATKARAAKKLITN